ncbi:MAG: IS66 family transposase [Rhodospirillales bacterium]|nr:IS66 family transposase [Rhodospirillales bacterium]
MLATLAEHEVAERARRRIERHLFKTWLEVRLDDLPEKSDLTNLIRYGLSRSDAFTSERYGSTAFSLDNPAVAIDNNAAERAMRPLCLGRRNWTFAGSDRGAENAATIMTIVETAKANDLNPQAYIVACQSRAKKQKQVQRETFCTSAFNTHWLNYGRRERLPRS